MNILHHYGFLIFQPCHYVMIVFCLFRTYLIDLGFLLNANSDISCQQIPLSHIPEDVYKMSVDWLNQRSFDALGSFVLWSLDGILADLASHQGAGKSSKKVVQQASRKSQVTPSYFSLYICFMHFDMES